MTRVSPPLLYGSGRLQGGWNADLPPGDQKAALEKLRRLLNALKNCPGDIETLGKVLVEYIINYENQFGDLKSALSDSDGLKTLLIEIIEDLVEIDSINNGYTLKPSYLTELTEVIGKSPTSPFLKLLLDGINAININQTTIDGIYNTANNKDGRDTDAGIKKKGVQYISSQFAQHVFGDQDQSLILSAMQAIITKAMDLIAPSDPEHHPKKNEAFKRLQLLCIILFGWNTTLGNDDTKALGANASKMAELTNEINELTGLLKAGKFADDSAGAEALKTMLQKLKQLQFDVENSSVLDSDLRTSLSTQITNIWNLKIPSSAADTLGSLYTAASSEGDWKAFVKKINAAWYPTPPSDEKTPPTAPDASLQSFLDDLKAVGESLSNASSVASTELSQETQETNSSMNMYSSTIKTLKGFGDAINHNTKVN